MYMELCSGSPHVLSYESRSSTWDTPLMQRVSTHHPRRWMLSCNHPNQAIDANCICSWGFFSIMGSSFTSYQHFSLSFKCSAKNTPWKQTKECDQVFCDAKSALASVAVPVHYNSKLPLRLATDASAYDIGAVSYTCQLTGEEPHIAYASRILTAAERTIHSQRRSQTLSIVFGVKNSINIFMGDGLHCSPITGL